MTFEEEFEKQLIKINNSLNHSAEVQARLEANLDRLDANVARHEAEIEKMTAGIRDLIVVSRTLLDSQKATIDWQKVTDENLASLAKTVDRLGVRLDQAEQARLHSNEDFDVKFSALIQAQQETERKLQVWIARQGNGPQ